LRAWVESWDASSRFNRPADRRSPRGYGTSPEFFEKVPAEEKELVQDTVSLCRKDAACFFENVGSLLVKDADRGRRFLLRAVCDDSDEDDMEYEDVESDIMWSELVSMLVSWGNWLW
jgi:hypothetical protein